MMILQVFLMRPCLAEPLSGSSAILYTVEIQGLIEKELLKLLQEVSETLRLKDRPPASLGLLQKRVDRDILVFQKALRSRGYYAATVTATIVEDTEPIQIIFHVEMGLPYLVRFVDIQIEDAHLTPGIKLPDIETLGLRLGVPAQSKAILDATKQILLEMQRQGFPHPKLTGRKVIVDHATHEVSINFHIAPGRQGTFGLTEIEGLESVEEGFIRKRIPWKEGDSFNVDLFSEVQSRLRATGLLATVQVKAADSIDEKGQLPVTISVRERKHRTIKGGISYKTDEGVGGKVSWEHRNLFGRGERLSVALTASEIAYVAESEFSKPGFLHNDQSVFWDFRLADDHPEAYDSRNVTTSVRIERAIQRGMTLGGGLAFRASDVEQVDEEEHFRLLFLPMYFDWDASDDILDPTRGGRLGLKAAPFYDIASSDLAFLKGYASYSHYLTVSRDPFVVLAGRGAFGSLWGADRDDIPADLRFYAGGGGSVRGFEYKTVGPLLGDDPIGGRSLVELSAELRVKVTNSIGLVGFIDGGNAYENELPNFDEELRWGAGMGVRYYSPIGPLRLDVAIPLNPRDEIDEDFQVYVSVGQAF
jgi:translocation and assembly module TamA